MNDVYLNLAAELYEKGTWSKETFSKRVILYAKERNIDSKAIDEFIKRVTKVREYTIDDKRKFLSVLTFDGSELKYGDIISTLDNDSVEKFYEMETSVLTDDKIKEYYDLIDKNNSSKEKIQNSDEINNENLDAKKETSNPNEPSKKENKLRPVTKRLTVSISDIINGNYTDKDILGVTEKDSDELFERLTQIVKPEEFNAVVESFKSKLGGSYARHFAIEWAKIHTDEITMLDESKNSNEKEISEPEKKDELIEKLESVIEGLPEEYREDEFTNSEIMPEENNNLEEQETIVPPLNFEEMNMPNSEEEYQEQANNIFEKEQDSNVEFVNAPEERIQKLKVNKGKVANYFFKGAILVLATVFLTNAQTMMMLSGGYMILANEIKKGKFNPKNPIGKALKKSVEKVMYIGMTKEEIEVEKGKSK